ncbi:hypothetical protein D3C71_2003930 [compost metagenome]
MVDLTSPVGPVRFSGYFAWLFWLFAHVFFLIGFRNRMVVLMDWAWAYWSFARHARVVTGIASLPVKTGSSASEVAAAADDKNTQST